MSDTPVYSGPDLAGDALLAALAPLVPAFNGAPAVYWQINPPETVGALRTGALSSMLICQSQDGGGERLPHVGRVSWSGLVVVRALSASASAARSVRDGIPARMELLSVPAGYAIAARFDKPIELAPKDGIHTRGQQWLITIERT